MQISDRGLDIIKEYEGFRAKPYLCPAGVPTIGYGTTIYPDGRKVSLKDATLLEAVASEYLMYQVGSIYGRAIIDSVKVELNQNQFDALCSFVYNIGAANFRKSTLLKKVNSGDFVGASEEFLKWNKANGKVLSGLTRRRKAERTLFESEV